MNPFSRAIRKRLKDRRLAKLVERWDALEALVVRVYKGGRASTHDESEFRRTRLWLQKNYPRWAKALFPYWQQTRVAGEPAREDPFAYLLRPNRAAEYVNDWRALQTLPAAREALNQYLADLLESQASQ